MSTGELGPVQGIRDEDRELFEVIKAIQRELEPEASPEEIGKSALRILGITLELYGLNDELVTSEG